MAEPFEELYEFDLHIYVGSRSWPDDVELYCQVTYPAGKDGQEITKDYMSLIPHDSLDLAIQVAANDIGVYMRDPDAWREEIKEKHERKGLL